VTIKGGLARPPGVDVEQPVITYRTEYVCAQTFGLFARGVENLHDLLLHTVFQSESRVKSREDVQAIIFSGNGHVILP
jgi:hypothetical protein